MSHDQFGILTSIILVAFVACMLALTGCNTVEGAGRDIESAGESVQDASH